MCIMGGEIRQEEEGGAGVTEGVVQFSVGG